MEIFSEGVAGASRIFCRIDFGNSVSLVYVYVSFHLGPFRLAASGGGFLERPSYSISNLGFVYCDSQFCRLRDRPIPGGGDASVVHVRQRRKSGIPELFENLQGLAEKGWVDAGYRGFGSPTKWIGGMP